VAWEHVSLPGDNAEVDTGPLFVVDNRKIGRGITLAEKNRFCLGYLWHALGFLCLFGKN